MTADNRKIYKCECGYVTHFEKALEGHCRFRGHKPLKETTAEPVKVAPVETPEVEKPKAEKKTTRKPRARKTVAKE